MNAALRNFRSAAWILGQAGAEARAPPPALCLVQLCVHPHSRSAPRLFLLHNLPSHLAVCRKLDPTLPYRRVCITCGPDSPCQGTSFGGFTRHKWENSKPRSPMHHNFYELNNRAPVCSCPDAVESPANDLLEPKSHWHLDLSSSLPIAIVNKPPR